jgi:transketolase
MSFYNTFKEIISKKIRERDKISAVIQKIQALSQDSKIAFYPCGRLSRLILDEIKEKHSYLFPRIIGCFDQSPEATTTEGIKVYPLSELNSFENQISLLIVPSNTFFTKEEQNLKKIGYRGKELHVSFFEISIPEDLNDNEILENIEQVYNLLSDEKSKATYILAWLSRLFNDETLTHLFESEEFIDDFSEPMNYKGMRIKEIDHTCKKELHSELYKMKYISPEKGDTVLDIGAYKGDTALFFAHHVGETGRVYAFEPVKSNLKVLKENAEENKMIKIIVPVNAGVGGSEGKTKVISGSNGSPWAFLEELKEGQETEILTIDSFVSSNNLTKVDFIKMDVEGLETDVISGAARTISKFQPKMAVAIYHKTTDLITLPLMLKKLGNYDFYIRSKVEGPFGFTLYCKKKNIAERQIEFLNSLNQRAKELRRETFALAVQYKETHVASAFSIIEILTSLYESVLKKEDEFILSKGHACFSLYPVLRKKGFKPDINGHPDIDAHNGITCTTGSLGHGLPIGIGMAFAKKIKNEKGKIYVVMGDGECQEGTIWESSLIASQHKLDNLVLIIDHNKLQALDRIENVISLGDIGNKLKALGWDVEDVDGHNISQLINSLEKSPAEGKPKAIVAHTVKGKGLSFMENDPKWQSRFPDSEELELAYKELEFI